MIASPLQDQFLNRLGVEDDPAFWSAMLDAVVGAPNPRMTLEQFWQEKKFTAVWEDER